MEFKLVYYIIFALFLYTIYRMVSRPNKAYAEEIEAIINSEESKVKGQFD